MLAGQHGAELAHLLARDGACLDGPGQLATVGGLLELVAEERAARECGERHLRLARTVCAEQVEMLSRAQIGGIEDRLSARRHAGDDLARGGLLTAADLPAQLIGKGLCRLRARIKASSGAVTGCGEAP